MITLIVITLVAITYVTFDRYCKAEWQNEDIDLLMTEGTGHD
jgi:hypothetical protein